MNRDAGTILFVAIATTWAVALLIQDAAREPRSPKEMNPEAERLLDQMRNGVSEERLAAFRRLYGDTALHDQLVSILSC